MLTIYNSLTRQKEIFKPLVANHVSMYVCGNTVYDYCHIGHARTMITFDVITRYLRAIGYHVNYVRNITDVDDKIIKRANERNISINELTEYFINAQNADSAALGLIPPNVEPRATDYIKHMITMIEQLIAKDFAYVAENGDVYYRVTKFSNYGQLAHKDLEGLRAGARVEINDSKQEPLDFVLWKLAKANEPSWDSPWGKGRPGWHIECSAMSIDNLGNHFDIHGGGFDLQFPHHENEIAQAEAATGEKFANTWMHVGFLQVNKEKMSKSLNNFMTIRDILKDHHPEVLRYFMITSHYRSPINYSDDILAQAKIALDRLYMALRNLPEIKLENFAEDPYVVKFNTVMLDDFNTPEALAVLFEVVHDINRVREQDQPKAIYLAAILRYLGNIFGILQLDPEVYLQAGSTEENAKIDALIIARKEARAQKNWAEADRIRKELDMLGIVLEDNTDGTIWRRS